MNLPSVHLVRTLRRAHHEIHIRRVPAGLPESAFAPDILRLFKIGQRTLHGAFGNFQICCNRGDCREAFPVTVTAVGKINIDCHSSVRQSGRINFSIFEHSHPLLVFWLKRVFLDSKRGFLAVNRLFEFVLGAEFLTSGNAIVILRDQSAKGFEHG